MSNWPKVTSENPVSRLAPSALDTTDIIDNIQLGLDDPTLFIQKGLINGQYVGTQSGKTFEVNGEQIVIISQAYD